MAIHRSYLQVKRVILKLDWVTSPWEMPFFYKVAIVPKASKSSILIICVIVFGS